MTLVRYSPGTGSQAAFRACSDRVQTDPKSITPQCGLRAPVAYRLLPSPCSASTGPLSVLPRSVASVAVRFATSAVR